MHSICDMRETKECKVTPGCGAHTTGRMEVPWPELGKAVGGMGLGRNSGIRFRIFHLLCLLASKWRCEVSNSTPMSGVWEKDLTGQINQELFVDG